ncbi:MAG: SHOCT domain-containing protein [Bacteroidales bacterium]|nr:SHOCT domain-containing protein [Bacteroidales bacterium]MDT8431474.1 SHOCT domain-containing protein [Bacteroidales bacterium]
MKYFQLSAILVVAAFMSSCATILTGTTQRITIDSTPQGADIIVDGRMMGTTPAKVRLDRDLNTFIDDAKDIRLELDGFYPDGYYLGTDIEPVVILNVFCPIGFALDAVTGAIMRYDNDYYNFRMVPVDPAAGPVQPPLPSSVQPVASASTQQSLPSASDESAADETNAEEGPDDYEKLMNLVELYEDGVITEEEFETEKAKIFKKKEE